MYFYKRFHSLFYYIFSKPVERRRRKALEPVPDGWLSAARLRDAIREGGVFVLHRQLGVTIQETELFTQYLIF